MIILENSKPILAEKIRYYRESAFAARLLAPPRVTVLKLALHLARVQERWRFADEELAPDITLDPEALAHDLTRLPAAFEGTPEQIAATLIAFFEGDSSDGARNASSPQAEPATPVGLSSLRPTKTAS